MKTVNDYEAERVMLILEFRFCTVSRASSHVTADVKMGSQLVVLLVLIGGKSLRGTPFSPCQKIFVSMCVCMCAHLEFICSRRVGFEHYESGQAKKR